MGSEAQGVQHIQGGCEWNVDILKEDEMVTGCSFICPSLVLLTGV